VHNIPLNRYIIHTKYNWLCN